MKIQSIKKLVEQYSISDLNTAEEAILNEQKPAIDIEGEDEGEQLTHIYGARFILEQMASGKSVTDCIREFSVKVRNSIS